jgi:hypothetical protein
MMLVVRPCAVVRTKALPNSHLANPTVSSPCNSFGLITRAMPCFLPSENVVGKPPLGRWTPANPLVSIRNVNKSLLTSAPPPFFHPLNL